jgi:integrase
MSRQLCQVLQGHLTLREAEAIARGDSAPPWFSASDGRPRTPGAFWTVWQSLTRRADVRYRKPHALRHTFASLLIQQGESLAYVRDQMGHHSIKITVDIYGHLVPGANKAAVDRLDAPGRNLYATEPVLTVPA